MSTAVALKTNPGRPQDVELSNVAALLGGGSPRPLYWGRTEPPVDRVRRRRDDELALFLLGVL